MAAVLCLSSLAATAGAATSGDIEDTLAELSAGVDQLAESEDADRSGREIPIILLGNEDRAFRAPHPPWDQIPPMPMGDPTEERGARERDPGGPEVLLHRNLETGETSELPPFEETPDPWRQYRELPGRRHGEGGEDFEESNERSFGSMSIVPNTASFPWQMNAKLAMRFVDQSNNSWWFGCSGSMVDAEVVLTAAHCVYAHNPKDSNGNPINIFDYAKEIYVYPGWDGVGNISPPNNPTEPYGWGRADVSDFLIYNDYVSASGWSEFHDYALLRVTRAVGMLTDWFALAAGGTCSTVLATTQNNASYPGNPCGTPGLHNGRDMYYRSGTVDGCSADVLTLVTTPGCFTAVWGGMSGSSLYNFDAGVRYVHAVTSGSNQSTSASYARLSPAFGFSAALWIVSTRGSDFDLQALNCNFGPATIEAGSNLTLKNFLAANATAGTSSGSVSYDVRLSTNTDISTLDRRLALSSFSHTFPAMSDYRVNIGTTVQIPANTAAGNYWVGVILNSATDIDAGNNDSDLWDAAAITVTCTQSAPTGVSASDGTYTDRVRVTWTQPSGATAFDLYRNTSTSSSTATRIATSITGSAYDDSTAVAGTTYYYWLRAKNACGSTSGFSAYNSGYIALPTGACCFPNDSCQEVTQAACVYTLSASNCCSAHSSDGCSHGACENCVCDEDYFCCDEEWDEACADQAEGICGSVCLPRCHPTPQPADFQGAGTSCSPNPCLPTGACCLDNGSCTFGTVADCNSANGVYHGDNVTCNDAICPQPGACCFDDGSCVFGLEADCNSAQGNYHGDNITCAAATDTCVPCATDQQCDDGRFCNGPEVCSDGFCAAGLAPSCLYFCTVDGFACITGDDGDECYLFLGGECVRECSNSVGACGCRAASHCSDGNPCTDESCAGNWCRYTNNTSPCDDGLYCTEQDTCQAGSCMGGNDPCPGHCDEVNDACRGACCLDDGSCQELTGAVCAPAGSNCCEEHSGSGCSDPVCEACVCNEYPSCCQFGWGYDCVEETDCWSECDAGCNPPPLGEFQGPGTSCDPNSCVVTGACCFNDGSCTFGLEADCITAGGAYQGDDITCDATICPQPEACCYYDTTCADILRDACLDGGGSPQNAGSVCPTTTCPDACGNGFCGPNETCTSCPQDCPATCGDGCCNGSETACDCPQDCAPTCGDGCCNGSEDCNTCRPDCPPICGDGVCDTGCGEGCNSCPQDCPATCGDGCCGLTENACDCPQDCTPDCGDGCCNGTETACDCARDCAPTCGDGCCNGSEDCSTCPQDGCAPTCGDGVCECGEGCSTCAQDCPPTCGDGCCNGDETCETCLQDCPLCSGACCFDNVRCVNDVYGLACSELRGDYLGDGSVCNIDETCPETCGDGICGAEEDCCLCPQDCSACTFTIGGAVYSDCANPLTSGVAGEEITATGPAGTFTTTTSGSSGLWQIPDVPCGQYTVIVGDSFCHMSGACPPATCSSSVQITVDPAHQAQNQSIQFFGEPCLAYDMNDDGFVSIIGDVPFFVDCVYFGTCDCPCPDGCTVPGDCNCDGFLSIIGDVPCFVDCVYFGSCEPCGVASGGSVAAVGFGIGGAVYHDELHPLFSGVEGVSVRIKTADGRVVAETSTEGASGIWRVNGLREGTYTVVFGRRDGRAMRAPDSLTIRVSAEREAANQSIRLLRSLPEPKQPTDRRITPSRDRTTGSEND